MAAKPGQIALDGQKPVFATGSPDGPVRSQSGPKGSAVVSKRSQSGTNPFLIPKNPPPGYIPLSGQYDSDRAGLLAQADEYEKQRKAIEDAGKRGNYRTKESQKRARAKMSDLKIKASNARSKALVYKRASEMFDDREKEAQRLKVLGETAQRARERDLRTLKKESDTAFDEVQADIEERREDAEGLQNAADNFSRAMVSRFDRVQDDATPEELARVGEAIRGGTEAAARGGSAAEINNFEQAIDREIAAIDTRVKDKKTVADLDAKKAKQVTELEEAEVALAGASAEGREEAQRRVAMAEKALGMKDQKEGVDTEKRIQPDDVASKLDELTKYRSDKSPGLPLKEALQQLSIEQLFIGSFSKSITAKNRAMLFRWAESEALAPGYDVDAKDLYDSVFAAMPDFLRTPANLFKIGRALGLASRDG